jgi:hypothetical protein
MIFIRSRWHFADEALWYWKSQVDICVSVELIDLNDAGIVVIDSRAIYIYF